MTRRNDDFVDLDFLEEDLRAALRADADAITPTDRLAAIQARTIAPPRRSATRWWFPLTAAAAAAAIVTGTVVSWDPRGVTAPPAGPPIASTSTSGNPDPTATTPSPPITTKPTSTGAETTAGHALPVYFVQRIDVAVDRWALVRTFVTSATPDVTDPQSRAVEALNRAMATAATIGDPARLWAGTTAAAVDVQTDRIVVRLDNGGTAPGEPDADALARISVQQLVWTVQAALGSTLPVTFEVADGSTRLLGRLPAADRYTRPASSVAEETDLAPIWVDDPGVDGVVAADEPFIGRGLATVPEGALTWLLETSAGGKVASGTVTAAGPAPQRSAFTITAAALSPGAYVLEVSYPSDSGPQARIVVAFTAE